MHLYFIRNFIQKRIIYFLLLICSLTLFLGIPKSIAQQQDVNVSATVQPCILILLFQPSDRILGNFSTNADVSLRFSTTNNLLHNFNLTTDNSGSGVYDFCANSIFPVSGLYDFYIRGTSHLRKRISTVLTFTRATTTTDLRSPTNLLIAGETSNIFDNKINSLDISTQIRALGTNNILNDLNQDGIVNELDLEITRRNFFLVGD